MTVEVNSTMTTRQSIAVAQVIPQYRYTEGLGRRRLLTPDEVLRLPNDQVLIIIRGQKILRAWKFDYTGHPYAREMSKTSIQEFVPCRLAESAPSEPRPPVTAMAISPLSEPPDAPPPVSPPPEPEAAKPVKRRPALYESAAPPEDF